MSEKKFQSELATMTRTSARRVAAVAERLKTRMETFLHDANVNFICYEKYGTGNPQRIHEKQLLAKTSVEELDWISRVLREVSQMGDGEYNGTGSEDGFEEQDAKKYEDLKVAQTDFSITVAEKALEKSKAKAVEFEKTETDMYNRKMSVEQDVRSNEEWVMRLRDRRSKRCYDQAFCGLLEDQERIKREKSFEKEEEEEQ